VSTTSASCGHFDPDGHDLSGHQLAQGLLSLVAERLVLLWCVDPPEPDDDLTALMEGSERRGLSR
jgi:hypothetical protein